MGDRALVIGGTGFLGQAIVCELRQHGWEVSVLARRKPQHAVDPPAFIQADRMVPGQLQAAVGDVAYHLVVDCAGYQRSDVLEAIDLFVNKIDHYIFVSTDYVYSCDPAAVFPIREDAAKQSDTLYADGKLQCETALLHAWSERQFPVTVLRPPHIMGAGKGLGCDIVQGRDENLLKYIRCGEGLTLLAEGQLLIQPVWNREVAACIAHLARMHVSFGEVFNCTGSESVTTRSYYQMIADCLGVPLRYESLPLNDFVQRKPDAVHYARHRMYDLTRLRELTGYVPRFCLTDAIKETFGWMLQRE